MTETGPVPAGGFQEPQPPFVPNPGMPRSGPPGPVPGGPGVGVPAWGGGGASGVGPYGHVGVPPTGPAPGSAYPWPAPYPPAATHPPSGAPYPAGGPYPPGAPLAGGPRQAGVPYPPPGAPYPAGGPHQAGGVRYPGAGPQPVFPGVPPTGRRKRRLGLWIGLTAGMLVLALVGSLVGVRLMERKRWADMDDDFDALLANQETSLLNGDEAGWLARVDKGNPELVEYFKRLYRELRALRVTRFQIDTGMARPAYPEDGESDVVGPMIYYCFATDKCANKGGRPDLVNSLHFGTRMEFTWRDGKYVITGTDLDTLGVNSPMPWGRGELTVAEGKRVIVAASQANAGSVATMVQIADAAAQVADRYAKFGTVPKYYVYLASDKDWKNWFRPGQDELSDLVQGYATPQGTFGYDIVVRMSKVPDKTEMAAVLRHEFGHAVTLLGVKDGVRFGNWDSPLVEGFAEYIGYGGASPAKSDRLSETRAFLRKNPVGRLDFHWPEDDQGLAAVSGAYGLGHFAIGCLAKNYGEDATFAFFDDSVRNGGDIRAASEQAFGKSWGDVSSGCLKWIRKTAGV